jgi:dCTP deaminase
VEEGMSVLQHEELVRVLRAQPIRDRLVVTPLLDESQVGPASIDLRLGTHFREIRRWERAVLDPETDDEAVAERREQPIVVPMGSHLWLHPGQFVLGSTLEYIRMPDDLVGQVLGRSSWARNGLIVATAVLIQPGWPGVLTLELSNIGDVPIQLYPGDRIAQLTVWRLLAKTEHPYEAGAKYVAPIGPEESRLELEANDRDRLREIGQRLRGEVTGGSS